MTSLDDHPEKLAISALSQKTAALHSVQLCRLAIFRSSLDMTSLSGASLRNIMKYPGYTPHL